MGLGGVSLSDVRLGVRQKFSLTVGVCLRRTGRLLFCLYLFAFRCWFVTFGFGRFLGMPFQILLPLWALAFSKLTGLWYFRWLRPWRFLLCRHRGLPGRSTRFNVFRLNSSRLLSLDPLLFFARLVARLFNERF